MSRNKEILCLKIEISNGRKELLRVFEEDEPEALAIEFCRKFKLESKFVEGLSNLIEFHIDSLLDQRGGLRGGASFGSCLKEGVNEKSTLVDNSKLDLYYMLFELLADPESNELNYRNGRFDKLNRQMQRILEPIWDELKESGDSIRFAEFTRAMDTLLPTLGARDRVYILNYDSSKKNLLKEEISNLKNLKESRGLKEYQRNGKTSVLNIK